jgi:hypothetical protein
MGLAEGRTQLFSSSALTPAVCHVAAHSEARDPKTSLDALAVAPGPPSSAQPWNPS